MESVIYDVQVIASIDKLRQIGIPEDAGVYNRYFKAWDLGEHSDERFGEMAKVSEVADDDIWFFYIPVKWLRFLNKQEALLNNLIEQSNETNRN